MNNLSIKKKLLIYNIFIQVIILLLFSISLHKTFELSSKDKLEATLKVVILDIVDDLSEHKKELLLKVFNEEKEYKIKPLYIRLLELTDTVNVINTTQFPKELTPNTKLLKKLTLDIIHFEYFDHFIVGMIKIQLDNKTYVIQVAINYQTINTNLENIIYILLFIVPIVLLFSIIGGYFLIYKAFSPIEQLLSKLQKINAQDLSQRLDYKNKNDEIDLLAIEINNLLERLEISFKKITQFSSDASHELKTPLTIIRGEIEIALRKERETKEYKNTLQNCLDEVITIQQTIDDLLFLAKNEYEVLEELQEDIYLDELCLEAYKEMQPFAKLKNIQLHCNIKEPTEIKGHHKLLKIALKNIIKNGITFSHTNSKVTITNYSNNDNFIICVEDHGIGIKKDEQEQIFEQFYRTDKSRSKESGGSGLGMAIVEKIVHLHKGVIELQSKENIGTKIYFKFPINKTMV